MDNLSNNQVIHQKKNGLEFLQFRKLLEFEDIAHAYTLKTNDMNVSVKVQTAEVAIQNYRRMAQVLGMENYHLVKPYMEHSENVVAITQPLQEDRFNTDAYTDGAITNQSHVLLATSSADCMTVLCYEPNKKVIASVHSGWRGTFKQILPNTIAQMVKHYQVNPKEVICCLCPTIHQCHFEVGEDVLEVCKNVISNEKDRQGMIIPSTQAEGKWYIDMIAVQKYLLKEVGVQEHNIIDSGICSIEASPYMYSFRADKQLLGLNAGIIGRKGGNA